MKTRKQFNVGEFFVWAGGGGGHYMVSQAIEYFIFFPGTVSTRGQTEDDKTELFRKSLS